MYRDSASVWAYAGVASIGHRVGRPNPGRGGTNPGPIAGRCRVVTCRSEHGRRGENSRAHSKTSSPASRNGHMIATEPQLLKNVRVQHKSDHVHEAKKPPPTTISSQTIAVQVCGTVAFVHHRRREARPIGDGGSYDGLYLVIEGFQATTKC